jgi:hypothetical protein
MKFLKPTGVRNFSAKKYFLLIGLHRITVDEIRNKQVAAATFISKADPISR